MKRFLLAAIGFALLASPMATHAAVTTVALDVHHAYCAACPSIVRSALAHAKGVKAVQVSPYQGKGTIVATVTYDDAVTSPAALIKVTTVHGYPANVAEKAAN